MWWDALKIQEENFAMTCSRPPSMLRRLVFLVFFFFGQANNRDRFIFLETIQNKHITTLQLTSLQSLVAFGVYEVDLYFMRNVNEHCLVLVKIGLIWVSFNKKNWINK